MAKASDNVFPRVILGVNTTDQAAPGDASWHVYSKADGVYARSSNSTVGPFGSGGGGVTVQDEGTPLSTTGTTLNFVGSGVTASGTGATKTITIAGGGGGSLTYVGYNSVGANQQSASTSNRVYLKKVTATAGLLASIQVYMRENADSTQTVQCMLFEDNAGAVGKVLTAVKSSTLALTNNATFGDGSTTSIARWFAIPVGYAVTATDYWVGWMFNGAGTPRHFYDTGGSDRYWDAGGDFITDGGRYSQTDSTFTYSVRALILG